jgi:hypothetical protein
MPVTVTNFPANPECGGAQWSVADEDMLAHLTALVLVGRARQAARVLQGAQPSAAIAGPQLKARLRAKLLVQGEQAVWHRDGLLFEIMAWLVRSSELLEPRAVAFTKPRRNPRFCDGHHSGQSLRLAPSRRGWGSQ